MASKASKPASRALAKLRKKGGASRTLARLVVDDLLERDIEELVDPADVAARTMEMLQGFAAMEALEETVSERIHWWVARLEVEEGTLGDWMTGEPTGRSEITTVQLAVPPRISGPYDGIQDTSLPSRMPAYASILPMRRTP